MYGVGKVLLSLNPPPDKDSILTHLGNGIIENIMNKNWVTVRDKCPQINVKFKWHTF